MNNITTRFPPSLGNTFINNVGKFASPDALNTDGEFLLRTKETFFLQMERVAIKRSMKMFSSS